MCYPKIKEKRFISGFLWLRESRDALRHMVGTWNTSENSLIPYHRGGKSMALSLECGCACDSLVTDWTGWKLSWLPRLGLKWRWSFCFFSLEHSLLQFWLPNGCHAVREPQMTSHPSHQWTLGLWVKTPSKDSNTDWALPAEAPGIMEPRQAISQCHIQIFTQNPWA